MCPALGFGWKPSRNILFTLPLLSLCYASNHDCEVWDILKLTDAKRTLATCSVLHSYDSCYPLKHYNMSLVCLTSPPLTPPLSVEWTTTLTQTLKSPSQHLSTRDRHERRSDQDPTKLSWDWVGLVPAFCTSSPGSTWIAPLLFFHGTYLRKSFTMCTFHGNNLRTAPLPTWGAEQSFDTYGVQCVICFVVVWVEICSSVRCLIIYSGCTTDSYHCW